ncbi:MAG: hypothetical protein LBP27_05950, partial [Treponema sp.]|nr:hypothetical protein [Treponema sp.]
ERIESGRFGAAESAAGDAGSCAANHTNYRFFLGARLGPSLRFYTPSGDTAFTGGDTYGVSLDTGLQASVQIVPLFSIQTEAVFTWDRASKWQYALNSNQVDVDRYTQTFSTFSLQFPLMARMNFYPGKFRVSPFLGCYLILPLGKITTDSPRDEEESFSYSLSPPLGLLGGLSIGFPVRTGIIFADIRYAADLAEPELTDGDITSYRRHMMTLSFGCEFGLLKKK